MTPSLSDFEHRLAALERQHRRWKRLSLGSLLLLALVALPAGAAIVTDIFVGRTLLLTDAAGRAWYVSSVDDAGNAVRAFVNPAGRVQSLWSANTAGASVFVQNDVLGRLRYGSITNPDGSAVTGMVDPAGRFRAFMLQAPNGDARIFIANAAGQIIASLP